MFKDAPEKSPPQTLSPSVSGSPFFTADALKRLHPSLKNDNPEHIAQVNSFLAFLSSRFNARVGLYPNQTSPPITLVQEGNIQLVTVGYVERTEFSPEQQKQFLFVSDLVSLILDIHTFFESTQYSEDNVRENILATLGRPDQSKKVSS